MHFYLTTIFGLLTWIATAAHATDISKIEQLVSESAYTEAIDASSEILKSDPDNAAALFLKATALHKSGDELEASRIYQYLTENHPDVAGAFNNLAVIQAEQEDYSAAINTLENAFQANPEFAIAYQNLKGIYDKLASDAYKVALNSETPEKELQLAAIEQLPRRYLIGNEIIAANDVNPTSKNEDETAATIVIADAGSNAQETKVEVESVEIVAVEVSEDQQSKSNTETLILNQTETLSPKTEPISTDKVKNQEVINTIEDRVKGWAKAWSSKDLERYLSYYSGEFEPRDNLSLDEWKEQRRGRLLWREYIIVELSNLTVEVDGDIASAKFTQHYKSNVYEGVGNKTLILKRVNEQWFINNELI